MPDETLIECKTEDFCTIFLWYLGVVQVEGRELRDWFSMAEYYVFFEEKNRSHVRKAIDIISVEGIWYIFLPEKAFKTKVSIETFSMIFK